MSKAVYESPLSSRYASDEMQYIFSPDKLPAVPVSISPLSALPAAARPGFPSSPSLIVLCIAASASPRCAARLDRQLKQTTRERAVSTHGPFFRPGTEISCAEA